MFKGVLYVMSLLKTENIAVTMFPIKNIHLQI
jgi:hypothetical protein